MDLKILALVFNFTFTGESFNAPWTFLSCSSVSVSVWLSVCLSNLLCSTGGPITVPWTFLSCSCGIVSPLLTITSK